MFFFSCLLFELFSFNLSVCSFYIFKGLNQERNIQLGDLENQRWKDVSVRGRRVRVFPDMRRRSGYTTNCPACEAKITRNRSWLVPAPMEGKTGVELQTECLLLYLCHSCRQSGIKQSLNKI